MKKYDDLEKTKDLFDIEEDIPTPIENLEMEGANKDNLTDEFTLGLKDIEDSPKEIIKEKNEKKKSKKKVIIIIIICLLILAILGISLMILLKEEKEPNKPEEPKVPEVIVEKDNYIYKDGVLIFLDEDDNELGTYTCKNTDENLCFVVNYSNEDNFDTTKYIYENEESIERRSKIYLNKYVFVYDNKENNNGIIILYNIEENKEEGVYTLVKGYSDSDYVILKNNNDKYGAIEFNKEGIIEKIEFKFDYLGSMDKDSKIVAKTNNKYYIYNKDGKLESKGISYEIKSYNDKHLVVDNEGYYVYDYKSNLIFNDVYDYINLLDNYVVLIDKNKLYIKDYANNKYNEEGIELFNTYYNETNIYNEKKELKESNKSFKVELVEDKIEITYYTNTNKEKNMSISTHEGKISSKYKYLNYFNGKLYFYKDEDEKELLGTYSCSNKNVLDKDSTTLNNCLIATDTFFSKNEVEIDNSENVGWIPIFNEKYAFINDSIDVKNPTLVLYDLENNKTLSKYSSIDTGSYTQEEQLTFKQTEKTYVIAKNKNNKYGVIIIDNEVKSAIQFNYDSIEKLRDYYMARESSGTYLLLDNKGTEITSKYGFKIVDYKNNYLKVIDKDNKYYVYDFEGNRIEETGYLHISLNEEYYVVITTDKKLDIHKYTDLSFKLSSTIEIDKDNYTTDYEVGKSDKGFTIKIKSTGETINTDEFGILDKDKIIEAPQEPTEETSPEVPEESVNENTEPEDIIE